MDILCTRCGEPWDTYSLVDDMTREEATKLKAGKGCPCCMDKEVCQREETCDECPLYQLDDYQVGDGDTIPTYFGRCRAKCFKPINQDASYIQHELASILGDDIDGLAGTMEDFNLL